MKLARLLLKQELSQISSPNMNTKNDIDVNTFDKSQDESSEPYDLTDPPSVKSPKNLIGSQEIKGQSKKRIDLKLN
jgi:hypothetical protein